MVKIKKFNLRGHQKKCRCCFQSFHRQQKHLKITEDIKANFFSVTQIELKSSANYSDEICLMCVKELTNFVEFKNKTAERQLELYKKFPDTEVKSEEPEIDIFQVNIKQEPEAYFSDDGFNNFEDNFVEITVPTVIPTKKKAKKSLTKQNRPKKKTGRKPGVDYGKIPERLCPDCGIYYKHYASHLKRYHAPARLRICDYCGYGTARRGRLREHMLNKHKKELKDKFRCHLCNFSTVYKVSIMKHMNVHEKKPKNMPCHCGKMFADKYLLAHHIKAVHDKALQFFCHLCPKSYVAKRALQDHIITNHTKKDVRDVICEACGKGFITKEQLGAHMKIVHIEGNISCEFQGCDKKFHKMSRLKRHMLSHVNVKNFNCEKCPAVFTHRTELNKHDQAHHLGLRYRCQVPGCSIEYMKRFNYRLHLKKAHSNLPREAFEKFMKEASTMKPV